MNCPACNTLNRDDAKFCKVCGKPLSRKAESTIEGAMNRPPTEGAINQRGLPTSEVNIDEADDLSLAPTLILTPEQMIAYHARRKPEGKREQFDRESVPESASATSEEQAALDIADMPGHAYPGERYLEESPLLPPPPPPSSFQDVYYLSSGEGEGVASQAGTYAGRPSQSVPVEEGKEGNGSAMTEKPIAEGFLSQEGSEGMQASSQQPDESEERPQGAAHLGDDEALRPGDDEGPLPDGAAQTEQTVQAPQTAQDGQAAPAGDFPVLEVGTTVVGRYEVTQILSDNEQEHIYQVIDHQGYQHCWNCGFEENVEGSDFCENCGAGLRDVSYIMHEYSASESKEEDARVQGTIVNTFIDQGRTYVIEQPQVLENVFPNGVHLLAACDSDAGTVRRSEPNEDSTLVLQIQRVHTSISEPLGVFIVADGLGGHDNGQVASRMAINIIAERLTQELLLKPLVAEKEGEAAKANDEDELAEMLRSAVEEANARLCQVNQREKTDMGSTLTGFMVVGNQAYIVNVGDSRTYILRNKQLYQVTTDHSLVGQLVAGGLISPEDVYTHPQRSQIFRSLGDKLHVTIDIFKQQLHPGDILLSCSDGLWEMVRDPQMEAILNNAADPQIACTELIEAANANGGEDNVSAVLVFVR